MEFRIANATEDQYGNRKENIFLALNEKDQYLGNGYVYPAIHHHQTNDTPYLLYCDITIEAALEDKEKRKIQQSLFDAVYLRAKELRNEHPELVARIYAGFEPDEDLMNFYLENGWEKDYSIFMERKLTGEETKELPERLTVEQFDLKDEKDSEEFLNLYNTYFVTPMDLNEFKGAKEEDRTFKNFYFYQDGALVGECSVRQEGDCGYIEILFTTENARGKGISKSILNYIHGQFAEQRMEKSMLEVWELNHRAVSLYQKMGYRECGENCMFPGITMA